MRCSSSYEPRSERRAIGRSRGCAIVGVHEGEEGFDADRCRVVEGPSIAVALVRPARKVGIGPSSRIQLPVRLSRSDLSSEDRTPRPPPAPDRRAPVPRCSSTHGDRAAIHGPQRCVRRRSRRPEMLTDTSKGAVAVGANRLRRSTRSPRPIGVQVRLSSGTGPVGRHQQREFATRFRRKTRTSAPRRSSSSGSSRRGSRR